MPRPPLKPKLEKPIASVGLPEGYWWAVLPSGRVHIVPDWVNGGNASRCARHLGKGWRGLKPDETFETKRACRDCIAAILLDGDFQIKGLANVASATARPEEPTESETAAEAKGT